MLWQQKHRVQPRAAMGSFACARGGRASSVFRRPPAIAAHLPGETFGQSLIPPWEKAPRHAVFASRFLLVLSVMRGGAR
jgi:hypothetical protein